VPTELDLVLGYSVGSGLINGLFHPLRIMGWLVVDQISFGICTPKNWGKKSPMLTLRIFFRRGWFNHQAGSVWESLQKWMILLMEDIRLTTWTAVGYCLG